MADDSSPVARVDSWRRVRDRLQPRRSSLTPAELDQLADAWFWLDEPATSVEVRRDSYRAQVAAHDDAAAAGAAWRLFFEHHLVGEEAPAAGWLERCRRHVDACGNQVAAGWLAVADADVEAAASDFEAARDSALRARAAGVTGGDPDLIAMALQAEGRARLSLGDRQRGLSLLDEAMVAVINDELQPLFTGWVFCNVVSACYSVADLRRATEWSRAALRWCASLREGSMYPGLCRVYAAELAYLQGDWDRASSDLARACAELTAFDPRYAGAAFALAGDLHRLRGDLVEAERAYERAHGLGSAAQPGAALLSVAQGRDRAEALRGLRTALRPGPAEPLPRALLLVATVELAAISGDGSATDDAVEQLARLAAGFDSGVLPALVVLVRGEQALARGSVTSAAASFAEAREALDGLGFSYLAARQRVRRGVALLADGDRATAQRELLAAIATFERLAARPDLESARGLLLECREGEDSGCPLTARELDVLRRVAAGQTNRRIAEELVLSEHTVARHVTNIRTKLGVRSRAAATAVALDHGWLVNG